MSLRHQSSSMLLASLPVAFALSLLSGCESNPISRNKEKKLLEASSGDLEQMRDFARLYYDKSEYGKAAKQYQRILEVEPKDAEASLALGMCYAHIGHRNPGYFEDGKQLLRTYNDELSAPEDARGLLALGVLYFKQASFTADTVDVALQRRLELEDRLKELGDRQLTSDSPAERRRLARESDNVRDDLDKLRDGTISKLERAKADQLEAAVRYLSDCIEVSKIDPLPYKLRAEANSLRGPNYYDAAVEDIDIYMELTVVSGRERFERMLQTEEDGEGNRVNTDAVLTTLHRLDRLEAMLLEMRASLLRRMGSHGRALGDLERVLDLVPERATTFAEIARCHEEMGNYRDAIGAWKNYIDGLPIGQIDAKADARLRIQDLEGQRAVAPIRTESRDR